MNIHWLLLPTAALSIPFILQGVELGPLEITINSLQKSIEARQQEIAELQQMWLRQQSELVQLTKDKDMQSVDVRKLKKQLTILSQKKIRTEGNISLSLCLSLFIVRLCISWLLRNCNLVAFLLVLIINFLIFFYRWHRWAETWDLWHWEKHQ